MMCVPATIAMQDKTHTKPMQAKQENPKIKQYEAPFPTSRKDLTALWGLFNWLVFTS